VFATARTNNGIRGARCTTACAATAAAGCIADSGVKLSSVSNASKRECFFIKPPQIDIPVQKGRPCDRSFATADTVDQATPELKMITEAGRAWAVLAHALNPLASN
jgi:hypothetical protein